MIYNANTKQNKAGTASYINFKQSRLHDKGEYQSIRNKERHYIIKKLSIFKRPHNNSKHVCAQQQSAKIHEAKIDSTASE